MSKWEYKQLTMLWMPEILVLADGSKLDWESAWEHINELGSQGWELMSLTPVANQPIVEPSKETPTHKALLAGLWGGMTHSPGNTEVLLFVFKRLMK